jgi:hypothetical protein
MTIADCPGFHVPHCTFCNCPQLDVLINAFLGRTIYLIIILRNNSGASNLAQLVYHYLKPKAPARTLVIEPVDLAAAGLQLHEVFCGCTDDMQLLQAAPRYVAAVPPSGTRELTNKKVIFCHGFIRRWVVQEVSLYIAWVSKQRVEHKTLTIFFVEIYQIRKTRWNGQVSQWCLHDATKMKCTVQRGNRRLQYPNPRQ